MAKQSKGARVFNRWRKQQPEPVSIAAVAEAIGDAGGQLFKWSSGERKLPLHLLVAVSRHTGIPIDDLADRDQRALLREAAALASGGEPEKRGDPAEQGGGVPEASAA